MPNLRVFATDFIGSYNSLNKAHTLTISKHRCLKATQTMCVAVFRAGTPSAAHAVSLAAYKSQAIKLAVDFTGAKLKRPRPYTKLDSTEKGNISYWTGMTFATLVADQILDVPRLLHAGALKKQRLARTNPASRSLADLVGQDSSKNWHVLEAKARQQEVSDETRSKWKTQAETIASIDGKVPDTRSFCYSKVQGTYSVELRDPPPRSDGVALLFPGGDADLVEGYYGPFRDVLKPSSAAVEREGRRIRVRRIGFDSVDEEFLFLGMDEGTLEHVCAGHMPELLRDAEGDDYYLGADGIAILTADSAEIR